MSFTEHFEAAQAASDAEGTVDAGLADEASTPVESVSTEAADVEVQSAPADDQPRYTVKVNGEDREVTLDDLQRGYMLQADYTRKTQELAEQRTKLSRAEAIAAAFEADPAATLEALAAAYGVSVGNQSSVDTEDLTPEEARLRNLEAQVQQQTNVQRQAQVDAELASLRNQYGEFDEEALLTHAITHQIPSLTSAYRDMQFDAVRAQAQAREQHEQQKKQADAAAVEAKRAAGFVEGGSSHQSGSVGTNPEAISSVKAAYEAAKQMLSR